MSEHYNPLDNKIYEQYLSLIEKIIKNNPDTAIKYPPHVGGTGDFSNRKDGSDYSLPKIIVLRQHDEFNGELWYYVDIMKWFENVTYILLELSNTRY